MNGFRSFSFKRYPLNYDAKLKSKLVAETGITFLSRKETLTEIAKNGKSLVRFGDGECSMIFKDNSLYFQDFDPTLKAKLLQIIKDPVDKVLVSYNIDFMLRENYPVVLKYERSKKEYSKKLSINEASDVGILVRKNIKKEYKEYFERFKDEFKGKTLGDATAFFLGFYYEEYKNHEIKEVLNLFGSIFKGRNILFIAPQDPVLKPSFRNLVEQGIIKSIKSSRFIDIPNENAFSVYNDILNKVERFKDIDLVLVQAGPAGTALAYDITKTFNLQTIDVGSWNSSLYKAYEADKHTF